MMENQTILLSTAYLAPVQYYAKLYHYNTVLIEQYEHYIKQTYRNRCRIAAAGRVQTLTVPVEKPSSEKCPIKDIRISDHGNWRHLHWNAIESAYRNSPFFEYYIDEILPFYTKKWDFLLDFNLAFQDVVCRLIDIQPRVRLTASFVPPSSVTGADDFRMLISPKPSATPDISFIARPYYQVFREKQGFLPNLSIVDLLFNMGPESLIVLRDACKI